MTAQICLEPITRYEDGLLVIVDKPSGLPAQGTRNPQQAHVYGILSEHYDYVGLHHRLDTPASGLMLLTLQRSMNKAIADAFRTHSILRRYHAVVLGDPGGEGEWTQALDDKAARTRFRRLDFSGGMSLLEIDLMTGRTHQIRRHAVQAGHPLIGDRRHGGAAGRLWSRLALHAARLELVHPGTGAKLTVDAPFPSDLRGLFPEREDYPSI
jgi:23S rRNA-/tRNA-specific pseudouridylate synthase